MSAGSGNCWVSVVTENTAQWGRGTTRGYCVPWEYSSLPENRMRRLTINKWLLPCILLHRQHQAAVPLNQPAGTRTKIPCLHYPGVPAFTHPGNCRRKCPDVFDEDRITGYEWGDRRFGAADLWIKGQDNGLREYRIHAVSPQTFCTSVSPCTRLRTNTTSPMPSCPASRADSRGTETALNEGSATTTAQVNPSATALPKCSSPAGVSRMTTSSLRSLM